MKEQIMHIFTKTPLHLGAGSSVGAIDLPIMRERHTRFPLIPGSSLKGVLADLYEPLVKEWKDDGTPVLQRSSEAVWLFGAEDASEAAAGSLLVGEGKLLAFPVRSARGGFAWITSPLTLGRYIRDARKNMVSPKLRDAQSCFASSEITLKKGDETAVVLEEYAFSVQGNIPEDIVNLLGEIFPEDPVWHEMKEHLVILSDELFSFFVENSCQIVTRIKIDDFTGTVAKGALFNQENLPAECLFYALLGADKARGKHPDRESRTPENLLLSLKKKCEESGWVIQIGGDATTGHGWCQIAFGEVLL